jgi:hypothetical protein
MTSIEVHDLPPSARPARGGATIGGSRTAAYEFARTDARPRPVLRLGRLIRIPSAPLLDLPPLRLPRPSQRCTARLPLPAPRQEGA